MLRMLHMCACNIKTKKNGNWLGPVMDLFGRLLDLSLENNAFPIALMDLFQKKISRLIKLIVTARPNLSWHYGRRMSRNIYRRLDLQLKIQKVLKLSLNSTIYSPKCYITNIQESKGSTWLHNSFL